MWRWLADKLSFSKSALEIAWELRFRSRKAYSLIDMESDGYLRRAFINLGLVLGFWLVTWEIRSMFPGGDRMPLPSPLLQIAMEVGYLLLALHISWATYVVLEGRGIILPFSKLLACATYAYLSYFVWMIVLLGCLAIVKGVFGVQPPEFTPKILKSALQVDTLLVFLSLLRAKQFVPEDSPSLFLPVVLTAAVLGVIIGAIVGAVVLALDFLGLLKPMA